MKNQILKKLKTDLGLYIKIRKYFTATEPPAFVGRKEKFREWLKENGVEISVVGWADDSCGVAISVDEIVVIDEEKFAWLLLRI